MENVSPVGFRLSPLEKTVWTSPALRSGTSFAGLTVHGALDADKLKHAFVQVAARHESLRTYFQLSRGFTVPFQLVRAEPAFTWLAQGRQDAAAAEAMLQEFLANAAPVPANADDDIFQVMLVEVGPAEHLLGVRVPALCCDRASLQELLTEVAGFYRGETPEEESVQYADFSEWHNELLATPGEELDEAKAFWAAPRPAQGLPLASRAAAVAGGAIGSYAFQLAPATLSREQAADEAFLPGCWQALLWRLTGDDTARVDVMLDGRPLEDLRHSIGLFAQPLPLVGTFDEATTFAQVFAQGNAGRAELEQWQSYAPGEPFGTVGYEAVSLPEDLKAGDVTFHFETCAATPWPFALALICETGAGEPRLTLRYDRALYAEADMVRLAGYLERTVEAAARDAGASVFSFDLLGAQERGDVLALAQGKTIAGHGATTFPQLFEAQAALTPDNPAVRHNGLVLSYARANGQANRIAAKLRALGVGPNVPVGLCLERSAEMIVALLGIAKSGGAYVPLLPDLPAARLAHQISETGLTVIVSMAALLPALSDFGGSVICLDRDLASLADESEDDVAQLAFADDLMYILYTSGSTGTPKGVEVTHGNVVNYVHALTAQLGLKELSAGPGLNFATVSTLGADLGNTCIFPPLVTGGCVTVVGYDAALDGALYGAQAAAAAIDVLKITPSNLRALLATGTPAQVLPRRVLLTGGEALTWDLAKLVLTSGTCTMLNHYGPTEATIGCLVNPLTLADAEAAASATVPLGKPIANMQVYVLDSLQRPVPVGAAGEICMAGAGITRGYINNPGQTGERFLDNPFIPGGSRLYRSGDRARLLHDGKIEFLGRVDHQVKIRGYRVELAEVETVLGQAAGVEQAIVLLAQDEAGPYLAAYLVPSSGSGPVAFDAVQQHVRRYLPEYMMPREFVSVEQVPLSANGKIDRHALPALSTGKLKPEGEMLAPRTPLEEQLAVIWKEALKLPQVGVRDNFFDLGGHSLLATQIIARLRSSMGLNVSIRMLFEAPTIEALALAIESTQAHDAANAVGSGDADLDELLAELEGLSDAEAEEVLDSETAGKDSGRGSN